MHCDPPKISSTDGISAESQRERYHGEMPENAGFLNISRLLEKKRAGVPVFLRVQWKQKYRVVESHCRIHPSFWTPDDEFFAMSSFSTSFYGSNYPSFAPIDNERRKLIALIREFIWNQLK